MAYCATRIAGFKVPASIEFKDALTRNASGKVLKHELRAPYWAGRARKVN
jgi:long-chain acyl-CoA synthetase